MSNRKMQTKPYGIEDKKVKIEKIMTRKEKTDNDKKFGIGLYDQPRSNTFSTKTKVKEQLKKIQKKSKLKNTKFYGYTNTKQYN